MPLTDYHGAVVYRIGVIAEMEVDHVGVVKQ